MKRLFKIAKELADDLFGLFFPNLCPGCGQPLIRGEEVICSICHFHLPKTYFHNDPENPLNRVFWGRVNLEAVAAYVYFQKGSSKNPDPDKNDRGFFERMRGYFE